MKRVLIVMLSCALHACSQFQMSSEPMDHAESDGHEAPIDQNDGAISQEISVQANEHAAQDLLLLRQQYCLEPRAQRREKIQSYDSSGDTQLRLEQLLLMSCELATFSAPIHTALARLRDAREWSPEDLAFFTFLKESTDALRAVEAKRYALQMQLEDTIQGITHIEEAIDARGGDHHLAEE